MSWWEREIVAAGKLPLMLCFLAFVVTFVLTRTITRSIRDGRGPFHDQVTKGGLHIHHAIPGLVLLIVGAFTGVGAPNSLVWRCAAAVLIGVGTSLVLDEFALILNLKDVYWSGEGQLSVQAVSLTAAVLGLMLAGFNPVDIPGMHDVERLLRIGATGLLLIDGVLALGCAVKGKYRCALFGIFLPGVALAGALRLARPHSLWARRRYDGTKLARATGRAREFDARWRPVLTDWDDFIGGRPTAPAAPGSS